MGIPGHLVLLGTQFRDSYGIGYKYSKLQQKDLEKYPYNLGCLQELYYLRDKIVLQHGRRYNANVCKPLKIHLNILFSVLNYQPLQKCDLKWGPNHKVISKHQVKILSHSGFVT